MSEVKYIELKPIKPFNDFYYRDCFYNSFFSLSGLLEFEPVVFMAKYHLYYDYDEKADCPINIGVKEVFTFEESINALGIEAEIKYKSDYIVTDVKNALYKGHPVIIYIDSYYEPVRVDSYGNSHKDHSLLIYGYNQEGKFRILEHNDAERLNYEPAWITEENLINGYNGYFANVDDGKMTYYEFYKSEKKNIIGIQQAREEFLCIQRQYQASLNPRDCLPKYSIYLEELIKRQEKLNIILQKLILGLNNIVNASSSRSYLCQKLDMPKEVQIWVDEIYGDWLIIRSKFVKYQFTNQLRKGLIEIINDLFANIIYKEDKLLEAIQKI